MLHEGNVVYPFGKSASAQPQSARTVEQDPGTIVLGIGQRKQLPDGHLGNVEIIVSPAGVTVNFSDRHTESFTYDFVTLSSLIRRPRKGESAGGVVGFHTTTPLSIKYSGTVVCNLVDVDLDTKQVTLMQ